MLKKQTIDFDMELPHDEREDFDNDGEMVQRAFEALMQHCHAASYNRGWWHDPITGMSLIPSGESTDIRYIMAKAWFPYVVACKIALIHSEVSEMLEAHRRDQDDDKIAFAGVTAEAADVVIRICDLLGMMNDCVTESPMGRANDYDLGAAILAKLPYNAQRADHDLAKRAEPGQKKY